jgi:hypothetical protein
MVSSFLVAVLLATFAAAGASKPSLLRRDHPKRGQTSAGPSSRTRYHHRARRKRDGDIDGKSLLDYKGDQKSAESSSYIRHSRRTRPKHGGDTDVGSFLDGQGQESAKSSPHIRHRHRTRPTHGGNNDETSLLADEGDPEAEDARKLDHADRSSIIDGIYGSITKTAGATKGTPSPPEDDKGSAEEMEMPSTIPIKNVVYDFDNTISSVDVKKKLRNQLQLYADFKAQTGQASGSDTFISAFNAYDKEVSKRGMMRLFRTRC